MKLTNTEELVIVQHILKLDERGYPPRLTNVEVSRIVGEEE
jgi:hypothetical protein